MSAPLDEATMLKTIGNYLLGEDYSSDKIAIAAQEAYPSTSTIVPFDTASKEAADSEVSSSMALQGNEKGETAETLSKEGEKLYRGVRLIKARKKYSSDIRNPDQKGSGIWLGTFNTPEEAAAAYDLAAFRMRGSRAILNFPLNLKAGCYVDPHSQSSASHTPLNISNKRSRKIKNEAETSREIAPDNP